MPQPQVVVQPAQPSVVVMGAGNCPSCRVGVLSDDYSCCGIFLAIFFFPIGILCCLAMKERYILIYFYFFQQTNFYNFILFQNKDDAHIVEPDFKAK